MFEDLDWGIIIASVMIAGAILVHAAGWDRTKESGKQFKDNVKGKKKATQEKLSNYMSENDERGESRWERWLAIIVPMVGLIIYQLWKRL